MIFSPSRMYCNKKFDRYYNKKKFLQGYVNLQMHKACITGDSGKLQFYIIFLTHINPENQYIFKKLYHKISLRYTHALYTISKYSTISHNVDI